MGNDFRDVYQLFADARVRQLRADQALRDIDNRRRGEYSERLAVSGYGDAALKAIVQGLVTNDADVQSALAAMNDAIAEVIELESVIRRDEQSRLERLVVTHETHSAINRAAWARTPFGE